MECTLSGCVLSDKPKYFVAEFEYWKVLIIVGGILLFVLALGAWSCFFAARGSPFEREWRRKRKVMDTGAIKNPLPPSSEKDRRPATAPSGETMRSERKEPPAIPEIPSSTTKSDASKKKTRKKKSPKFQSKEAP